MPWVDSSGQHKCAMPSVKTVERREWETDGALWQCPKCLKTWRVEGVIHWNNRPGQPHEVDWKEVTL